MFSIGQIAENYYVFLKAQLRTSETECATLRWRSRYAMTSHSNLLDPGNRYFVAGEH
jgi:hypothetical protein